MQNIDDPVGATDPENTPLTYNLEGQDADAFTLDTRSGQIRTDRDETYDYETKPRYVLSIKATDGHGGSSTILVLINPERRQRAAGVHQRRNLRDRGEWRDSRRSGRP